MNKMRILSMGLALSLAVSSLSVAAAPAKDNKEKVPASLDADEVEYDMRTGQITATTNVLMKRGDAKVTGKKATYNLNTMDGSVIGDVIAVRGDIRVTCDMLISDKAEHMQAIGKVHGTQLDREFTGEKVDYYPNQNDYIRIENGGTAKSKDGIFRADFLEGWMKDEHYVGIGNAYVNSPTKDLEAGGDRLDYYGKEEGKAIMTGHSWAIQDNNTLHGNKLTLYMAKDGSAKVQK